MPKPLNERQQGLLKPGARLSDLRAAMAETRSEITRLAAEEAHYRQMAVDVNTPVEAARSARDVIRDVELDRERHAAWIVAAERKAEAMVTDEASATKRAAYEAARARRNELVSQLRDVVAPALEAIVSVLEQVERSDSEIETVNRDLPRGMEWLAGAEAVARGHHANGMWDRVNPVERLTKIKLPHFGRHGRAWPRDRAQETIRAVFDLDRERLLRQEAAKTPEAKVAAAAAEAARWKRYTVRVTHYPGHPVGPVATRQGPVFIYEDEAVLEMTADGVRDAKRAFGLTVADAPAEWRRYRVRHSRPGYSGGIFTRAGMVTVGSDAVEVEMNSDQVRHARGSGKIVDLIVTTDEQRPVGA